MTKIELLINIIAFFICGIAANIILNDWDWLRVIIVAFSMIILYVFIFGVKNNGQ